MADIQLSTLGSVIKTAYEGQANTNAFTDAEKTKLAGTGADSLVVTGTAGTSGNLVQWNADGDAVGSSVAASSVLVDGDKTGADAGVVSGTAGTSGNLSQWNADGDLVDASLGADGTGFPVEIGIACSDETTALTTGTAKATFRVPFAMTLTGVRASVTTAPVGSTLVVDINDSGTSVLSTKLSIDASEKTSTTAATPAVISDSALADDAEITIDIDQIGSSTAGAGLKVWLIGARA